MWLSGCVYREPGWTCRNSIYCESVAFNIVARAGLITNVKRESQSGCVDHVVLIQCQGHGWVIHVLRNFTLGLNSHNKTGRDELLRWFDLVSIFRVVSNNLSGVHTLIPKDVRI